MTLVEHTFTQRYCDLLQIYDDDHLDKFTQRRITDASRSACTTGPERDDCQLGPAVTRIQNVTVILALFLWSLYVPMYVWQVDVGPCLWTDWVNRDRGLKKVAVVSNTRHARSASSIGGR